MGPSIRVLSLLELAGTLIGDVERLFASPPKPNQLVSISAALVDSENLPDESATSAKIFLSSAGNSRIALSSPFLRLKAVCDLGERGGDSEVGARSL